MAIFVNITHAFYQKILQDLDQGFYRKTKAGYVLFEERYIKPA